MPFDPSILSEIGGYGPNPVKAQSDAYTLAGQQQGVQMRGIELQEAKRSQSDDEKIRQILKSADLSSFEGKTKAASEITKISPEKGMKFMGQVQTERQQQQKYTLEELLTSAEQAEQLGGALDSVATQLQAEAQKPGANPAMLDAKAKQLVIPAALQLRNATPALAQYIDKFLQDPQSLTYQGVMQAYTQSKTGRENLRNHIAEKQAETARKREETYERDVASRGKERDSGTNLSPEAQALKDDLAARDPTFMARSGAKSIAQQNKIIEDWAKQGKSADDIIGSRQATKGTQTEVTALAKQKAGLVRTEKSIVDSGGFLDQAEAAVKEVDLNKVKGLGKLSNWSLEQITDPALQNYHTRITELRAEYAIVLSKGGQVTDAARTEAEKVIPDYMTPASFARVKQAVQQGIEASSRAVDESIAEATKSKGASVAPFSDAEKEKRYQEWKKSHGG